MSKPKWSRILAIAVPVLALGLIAYNLLSSRPAETELIPAPVRVAAVETGSIRETLRYAGTLRPETTSTVVPKVSGRIVRILASEGDLVQVNQVLAEIDSEVLQLQAAQARAAWQAAQSQYEKARQGARPEEVASARASVEQAQKDLEAARLNLERTENLYAGGAISQSRYEEVRNAFANAQTQVENSRRSLALLEEGARPEDVRTAQSQAEAALRQMQLAELQLSYAQVRSPVAGRVAAVHTDPGNLAGPQTPILSIVNEGTILARVPVPEQHYGKFTLAREQIRVEISPSAYPGEPPFPGTVTRVASTIDPASRTFEVDVAVSNRQDLLRPGMYVNLEFILAQIDDAVLVPNSAIIRREGRELVFAYLGAEGIGNSSAAASGSSDAAMVGGAASAAGLPTRGFAELRHVETGIRGSQFIQVVGGLSAGEPVIVEGGTFLEDGQLTRNLGATVAARSSTGAAANGADKQ